MEIFKKYEKQAHESIQKKKEEREATERKRKQKAEQKKKEEEAAQNKEATITELTDEEAEKLKEEIEKVSKK